MRILQYTYPLPVAKNTGNEEGDCIEKEQQGYYKACTSYRK